MSTNTIIKTCVQASLTFVGCLVVTQIIQLFLSSGLSGLMLIILGMIATILVLNFLATQNFPPPPATSGELNICNFPAMGVYVRRNPNGPCRETQTDEAFQYNNEYPPSYHEIYPLDRPRPEFGPSPQPADLFQPRLTNPHYRGFDFQGRHAYENFSGHEVYESSFTSVPQNNLQFQHFSSGSQQVKNSEWNHYNANCKSQWLLDNTGRPIKHY